jgi:sterol desaturase/sphingolipid hydroxylase (fatty acid hydroxylase superfamily)
MNGILLLVFWGAVALAAVVTYLQVAEPRSIRAFFVHLVPSASLRHPSARADILFWLSRRLFFPLLVLPLTFSTIVAGHLTYSMLEGLVGAQVRAAGEPGHLALIAFTITMFLAYDLSYYLYHVLQHRIRFMWELHKVHHSAEVMVGVTKDRIHPLDEIMNNWWNGLIPGATFGVWLFFLQDPVELTIFGINVYFIRNALLMMDFVRHTHMKFSYGRWLNAIFICPHYHQLHHSVAQEHWDRNFGLSLTLWDWLFGTLVVPKPNEDFVFGLQNREAEEYRSVLRLYWVPIKHILLLMAQSAAGLRGRWKRRTHMASHLTSAQMPKKMS